MIKQTVIAGLIAMLAMPGVQAAERKVEMDFAIAPEKIQLKRIETNAKQKRELAEYSIVIPETAGKDFTFQCKLIPLRFKAYAGAAIGIGNDKMASQQLKVQLRLGDKNRSSLTFGSGSRCTALTKPAAGIKVGPLVITIKYHAESNTSSLLVTGTAGKTVMQKDKKVAHSVTERATKQFKKCNKLQKYHPLTGSIMVFIPFIFSPHTTFNTSRMRFIFTAT